MNQQEIIAALKERADIMKWLSVATKREMELRIHIANALVPDIKFGKNKGEFIGFPFVVELPATLKVDPASIDTILKKINVTSCDDCIKREPSLDKKKFKKLPKHLQKALQHGLILKLGTLTLEI